MYLGIKEVIIGTSVGRVIVNSVKYFFLQKMNLLYEVQVFELHSLMDTNFLKK